MAVQICPAVEVMVTGGAVYVDVAAKSELLMLVVEVVVTLTVEAELVSVLATGVNVAVAGMLGQKSAPWPQNPMSRQHQVATAQSALVLQMKLSGRQLPYWVWQPLCRSQCPKSLPHWPSLPQQNPCGHDPTLAPHDTPVLEMLPPALFVAFFAVITVTVLPAT